VTADANSVAARLRAYVTGLDAFDAGRAVQSWGWFHCPCCACPTLTGRAGYEVCPLCLWEDDGQDDHNADIVTDGPNGSYSLTRARANFAARQHMFDVGDGPAEVAAPSEARRRLVAFVKRRKPDDKPDLDALHVHLAALAGSGKA
jgi:hypothetical protein